MSKQVRVISRLDIKAPNLIKGIRLEGLRVMGDPQTFACQYYAQGIDEILYMDVVASLYERSSLHDVIRHAVEHVFIPITVGGGIRSLKDATEILSLGADKIAINTAAVKQPELIAEIARQAGSQAVVLSVECKREQQGWQVYTDNGREKTGRDVIEWVKQARQLGVGEILLTSVDREGTRKGFDLELLQAVSDAVRLPIIASGGFGELIHASQAAAVENVTAVAVADGLHYKRFTVKQIKQQLSADGFAVRTVS